jgi:hypothetical protein
MSHYDILSRFFDFFGNLLLEKIGDNRIQQQEMNTVNMCTYVNFSGKCAEAFRF